MFPPGVQTFPDGGLPSGKLRIKLGIDPTGNRLHLGHLVPLRVFRKLMLAGHDCHIVIGSQTAQLGDPSGRDTMRPVLDRHQVRENAISLIHQLNRILHHEPTPEDCRSTLWHQHWNHTWFDSMRTSDFMQVVAKFTVTHLMSRDAFQKRAENGDPIGAHELLVPILQGWDSVQLKANVEIGGTDQLFNFQVSRKLQEMMGQEPEVCILTPVINGTDGRKMSKSLDNCIFVDDTPDEIFGKCMSVTDQTMNEWIPLLTNLANTPLADGAALTLRKKLMAWQIVEQLWGTEAADQARSNFERVFQSRSLPTEMRSLHVATVIDAVVALRGCSKTEARRLINGSGVKVNDAKISTDGPLADGDVVSIARRDFGRVSKPAV